MKSTKVQNHWRNKCSAEADKNRLGAEYRVNTLSFIKYFIYLFYYLAGLVQHPVVVSSMVLPVQCIKISFTFEPSNNGHDWSSTFVSFSEVSFL